MSIDIDEVLSLYVATLFSNLSVKNVISTILNNQPDFGANIDADVLKYEEILKVN